MRILVFGLMLFALSQVGTAWSEDLVRDADSSMFPSAVQYDTSVPTPAAFLGHPLGAHPIRHHQLVEYINDIANTSDRMSVEVIGYSHERRPILFIVVTSPENHARIEDIRQQHIALTEPALGKSVNDDMPLVTWLNYGVHGAESSGMDAAMPTIYHLAAAQGGEIDRQLSESVILITAIFNPDGHAKRIAWLDAYGGKNVISDPSHVEHLFNWTFARTNHYWFDLNRQWLLLSQPESRAWMRKWHEWRPNVTVDYHEMGGGQTYYFHPGVASRTNPLALDEAERLMALTVSTSEEFLDAEGRLYFHGEDFDNYYVGKGSTFPLLNGGVGILYEAGAALGRELESDNGLRTYRENIRKHFRTSIASIEGSLNHKSAYLRYQKQFYSSALEEARKAPTKAYVFDADGDAARMHHFVDLLNYHRINTYALTRNLTVNGQSFAADSALLVPLSQPQYRLIRSLFETVDEFEDATFYDVSTWTMPHAFGLRYAALSGRNFRGDLLGESRAPAMPVGSTPTQSSYGYVFAWNDYYAPRALNRVLDTELLAKVATEPFSATTSTGVQAMPRGSIFIPIDRQQKDAAAILAVLRDAAANDGVTIHSLVSGRSAIGTAGVDLGGPSFKPLKKPSILLVVGEGTNFYDAGEAWHLLDFRMETDVTLRPRDRLADVDWSRYSHIVFPSGEYEEYLPEFLDRLRLWVNEGGTLIGMREAAQWARDNVLDYVAPTGEDIAQLPELGSGHEELLEEEVDRFRYADKADQDAVDVIGGAIFAGDLDITHPIGFGYRQSEIFLHKNSEDPWTTPQNPYATVIAYDTPARVSGYASAANEQALSGSPALIADRLGEGSVILFADNPNFRGYWYGTNKLFLNALYFSKAFEAQAED